MGVFDYIRDPLEIERRSFLRIRELADLNGFDADERQVAMRLIHTCGEPGIVDDLSFGKEATAAGIEAVERGATVLCDVETVRQALSRKFLSGPIRCFLNAADIGAQAHQRRETRAMTALGHWPAHLAGSVVAIGNAPTALFRLLEMLENGAPRPALIVAMPVGFIGARESKEALIERAPALGVSWITLRGYRGGSTLTAAALNAIARLAQGVRW